MRGTEIPQERCDAELHKLYTAIDIIKQCKNVLRRADESADETKMLHEVCRIIVDVGDYRMSWIGFVEHDAQKTITLVTFAGHEQGYLSDVKINWSDTEFGHGPAGTAIRTGKPFIARQIMTEPTFSPWRKEARKRGYASVVAIPLIAYGESIGILAIYSGEPDDFTESEVDLITDLAGDIAYGIVARRIRQQRDLAEKERERSLKKYDEERRRLRVVLDALPVGVFIADADGHIIQINQPVEKIWGGATPFSMSIDEYGEYKGWWANTNMPIKPREWALARAITRGVTSTGEVINIERFDGTRGTILNSAAPIRDEEGQITGAVAVVQDITHMMKLERQLKDAKDRAEMYLDLMSHDINNLNQTCLGYLEMMRKTMQPGDREIIFLEKSLDALKNSSRLISNVRKLQEVEAGRLELVPVNLCHILSEVRDQYSHLPGRDVTIEYKGPLECTVVANELLKDVFLNLVGNAVKHSDPDKPLTVSITQVEAFDGEKNYHKVIVADNGPGIPDSLKSKLFTRLQRGKTKAHGKGLGLYLVKSLVEDFHGRVWVEDSVPGNHTKGSRFIVMLPAAKL